MSEIRLHNFGAGPCVLPQEVLDGAAAAVKYWAPAKLSILEVSHRHPAIEDMLAEARALVRELLSVPERYHILFLQGGASTQFGMVPMNFLTNRHKAAFVDTGYFSQKAMRDAAVYGKVQRVASAYDRGYRYYPANYIIPKDAAYFHITSNNTIEGTQAQQFPDSPVPMVCDMSSDIFSRQIDVNRFALIYAGAQKNMGPAGMTLVIIDENFLRSRTIETSQLAAMMDYRNHANSGSLYNTAPVFSIYTSLLNLRWLKARGGVAVQEKESKAKSQQLYRALDENELFIPFAEMESRSSMNVTFHLPEELETEFLAFCAERSLTGLKGYKTMGGFRASLYNALAPQSVTLLCDAIQEFSAIHSPQLN